MTMNNSSDKVMNDKIVKIVCPRAEELSVILNNVKCDECGVSFSNEPRLRMHVLKIHEHKNLVKTIRQDVRYHCPVIMCVYALKSQRYFTTMKYLKQHYLKVHAAKKFPCAQCEKSFSTEAAMLAHRRICGVQFICSCLKIYGTYEALLTHGKRNAHTIDEKYKKAIVRKPRAKPPHPTTFIGSTINRSNQPITILPRTNNCSFVPTTAIKIAFDVAVQTDEVKRQKRTPSPSKSWKRRESRQTQTSNSSSREKRARKTVETQTVQNSRSSSSSSSSSSLRKCLSIETAGKREKTSLVSIKQEKISLVADNEEKDTFVPGNEERVSFVVNATKEEEKSSFVIAKQEEKSSFCKDLVLNENFTSDHLFPSSPLVLQHDVGLQDFWEEKNTTLGTQTSPGKYFFEALSDSVTQTDFVSSFYRNDETIVDSECLNIDNKDNTVGLNYVEDTTNVEDHHHHPCYSYATSNVKTVISRSDPMLTIDSFRDRYSSTETQTETTASLSNNEENTFFDDSTTIGRNFALSSNNETQTTENFDNMEQLLYSNTCTQTCNDILPRDLGLSDIQTQTAWPELEDDTEIVDDVKPMRRDENCCNNRCDVVASTSSCRSWLNTRISHTETQTDLLSIFDEFP